MGFTVSWVAASSGSADRMLAGLGLTPTGVVSGVPEFSACLLRLEGWDLVVYDTYGAGEEAAPTLAGIGDLVTVSLIDSVMASEAAGWRGGVRTWWLSYQCEGRTFTSDGAPPAALPPIQAAATAKQEAADAAGQFVDHLYDVPIDLGSALVGYRHDRVAGTNQEYHELA